MTRHSALFWFMFALLAPLMLVQAAWASRTATRLPPGAGAVQGIAGQGNGEPISLLMLGESPVAGVGCSTMDEAVAAQTAGELARLTGRPVLWHAAGVNGIRIQQTLEWLLPQLPQRRFDHIVAVHGVNDTTGLTTVSEWRERLSTLADRLAASHGTGPGAIHFAQVAPMHLFTALPQPLRSIIGLRAKLLDRALREHPGRGKAFEVVSVDFPLDTGMLAEDGYHPSPSGHAHWGRGIARYLLSFAEANALPAGTPGGWDD